MGIPTAHPRTAEKKMRPWSISKWVPVIDMTIGHHLVIALLPLRHPTQWEYLRWKWRPQASKNFTLIQLSLQFANLLFPCPQDPWNPQCTIGTARAAHAHSVDCTLGMLILVMQLSSMIQPSRAQSTLAWTFGTIPTDTSNLFKRCFHGFNNESAINSVRARSIEDFPIPINTKHEGHEVYEGAKGRHCFESGALWD